MQKKKERHNVTTFEFGSEKNLVSRETIFKGRRVVVLRDELKEPDGSSDTFEVVNRMDAIWVVPTVGRKILLIHHYRVAENEYFWEIPAGAKEEGETEENAASRELLEETGYSTTKLQHLQDLFVHPGLFREHASLYLAECSPEHKEPISDDKEIISEVRLFEPEEIKKMMKTGEIRELKTFAALGYYLFRREFG